MRALALLLLAWVFRKIDARTRPGDDSLGMLSAPSSKWFVRLAVFIFCGLLAVVAVRGTLRQGPPLRWGDAVTTDSTFANQSRAERNPDAVSAAQPDVQSHRDNI